LFAFDLGAADLGPFGPNATDPGHQPHPPSRGLDVFDFELIRLKSDVS